jgi:hypothetical protein
LRDLVVGGYADGAVSLDAAVDADVGAEVHTADLGLDVGGGWFAVEIGDAGAQRTDVARLDVRIRVARAFVAFDRGLHLRVRRVGRGRVTATAAEQRRKG